MSDILERLREEMADWDADDKAVSPQGDTARLLSDAIDAIEAQAAEIERLTTIEAAARELSELPRSWRLQGKLNRALAAPSGERDT